MVVSDISPKNTTLVRLDPDHGVSVSGDELGGQSIDQLLVTAFRVPGRDNIYLKQQLVKALRLMADGSTETDEFKQTLGSLLEVLPALESESPIAQLIKQIELAQDETGGAND